ncbi:MAG: EpsI family protein [Phycisphaerales bacterium]|nr:EpsI family protein [Phycisphaerales bacterium]
MTLEPRHANRRLFVATATACVALFGAGFAFRAYAARLSRMDPVALANKPDLSAIPMRFGPWRGEDIPVDEYVRKATDSDDLIHRRYARTGSNDSLRLYLAYGIRARDLAPHRPEVCYPGAGWSFQSREDAELSIGTGTNIPCRIMTFSQGGFDLRRVVVINYYIVDGIVCADMESLRSKAWRGSTAIQSIAQVQISCTTSSMRDLEAARRVAMEFAQSAAPELHAALVTFRQRQDTKP